MVMAHIMDIAGGRIYIILGTNLIKQKTLILS